MKVRLTEGRVKTPNTKLQTPEKLQNSSSNSAPAPGELRLGCRDSLRACCWGIGISRMALPRGEPFKLPGDAAGCSLSPSAGQYRRVVLVDTGAVLSAREDCCFAVPKGQSRISPAFQRWVGRQKVPSPEGRLRSNHTAHPSAVLSGLVCQDVSRR